MTTHDMQPEIQPDAGSQAEMRNPVAREDRPETAEPMRQQPQASQHEALTTHDMQSETGMQHEAGMPPETMNPRRDDAPLETVDASGQVEPPTPTAHASSTAGPADQVLFGDGELTEMRSRWTDVQAAFVDDPRDCVQKADGLVADMVDRLTSGFAQARSGLEAQWSRGEQVSTEDLRVALQRYRDFFERLLAV
jgi:hypothetical protein